MTSQIFMENQSAEDRPESTDSFHRYLDFSILSIEVMVGCNKIMVFAKGVV